MLLKKEWVMILFLITLFIAIRSIHFSEVLNFSSDQAIFSIKALELYTNGEISLIGPPISFMLDGRQVSQGGIIYYFLLIFLVLGNFDPIKASYLFMIFCGLMVIPLYFGTKWLMDRKAALLVTIIYVLLPYYIDFTRFLWNATFQFSLIPVLIFLMGLYKKNPTLWQLSLIGVCVGMLLQFHYQFIILILGLFIYHVYLLKRKLNIFGYLFGVLIGFGPLIIFELRNNFYNLRTVMFYLQNWGDFAGENFGKGQGGVQFHYLLSLSFFAILILIAYLRRYLSYKIIWGLGLVLFVWSMYLYIPAPKNAYGMSEDWNYLQEEKVNKIIRAQNKSSYSVTNLIYDTLGNVQRYLLLKDGIRESLDNYGTNDYLFVISDNKDFSDNRAYEIQAIKPYGVEGSWIINPRYKLTLIKRLR